MSRGTIAALMIVCACAVPRAAPQDEDTGAETTAEDRRRDDHTHEDETEHRLRYYDDIEVTARGDDLLGIATASNEGTTGHEDLKKRPILRAGELVETVPGAIATQHSGGGKANQFFLRGFNLDHGTDFAVSVGGIPVNMPTHGHGQGYADLNFLIPELVERARYRKGPYRASAGDFSSAGSVDFDLVGALPRGIAHVTLGSFGYGRALAADTFGLLGGRLTGAFEYFHDDGPWDRGDDYERLNGVLAYNRGDAFRGWSIVGMGSDGDWLATDQIPRRAVEEGLIDRYGLIDPGPRGNTSRYSLSGEYHFGGARSLTAVSAYAIRYDFRLISNFTYFLENPVDGDQFEQVDERWIVGASASHRWHGDIGSTHTETAVGIQVRHDDISNGLYPTADLERTGVIRQDAVGQQGVGLWGNTWIRFSEAMRLNVGLRADYYGADVEAFRPLNSGSADDWMLNPKLSLVYRPWSSTELSLNAGSGFHSNDARGATIRVDPVTGEAVRPVVPLVRARGLDVGVRTYRSSGYHGTLTGFWLALDSELLFVGDGGTTEASRPSRRIGVEWTNFWRVSPRLDLDLDVSFTSARFTDDDPVGNDIPGAIVATAAGGLTFSDVGRWFGALRLRYFSGGPLVEDGSVTWGPTALLNARLGFNATDRLQLIVEGYNLLGREDDDIAYFYTSRLPGEPLDGIDDVHFHPVVKPSVRGTLVWRF
ncbi:MAG: TonB-dependent receptor [Acidobacteriota bacterium]|jgi:hypothetical protein